MLLWKLYCLMIKHYFVVALLFSVSLAAGCTWVKPTAEAQKVRLVPADRVADCVQKGRVTTSTMSTVSIVNRNPERVKEELVTLAQNEAVIAGADTIVTASKIEDGRQTFAMYDCIR